MDGGGTDPVLVVQRVADLLALDPELTRLAVQTTLPGETSPIAALFADPRLVERAGDGSFVIPSDRESKEWYSMSWSTLQPPI